MNAWNWTLAVVVVLALVADAPRQQPSPFSLRSVIRVSGFSLGAGQLSAASIAKSRRAPVPCCPSRVFDNPPAGEIEMPFVTPQAAVIRTAYQSPWSSWTTEVDPDPPCMPSSRPAPGPDCNVCDADVVTSTRGQLYFRAEALALRRSHPPAQPVAFDLTTEPSCSMQRT